MKFTLTKVSCDEVEQYLIDKFRINKKENEDGDFDYEITINTLDELIQFKISANCSLIIETDEIIIYDGYI